MKNCIEWTICEHAIYCLGGATVPIFPTSSLRTVSFILGQTNLSTCVCTNHELSKLVQAKKTGSCPHFKTILLVNAAKLPPESVKMCKEAGLEVISLAEVESHGSHTFASRPHTKPFSPPSGSDICTFCYTSGTTGIPKGALITHANIIAAIVDSNVKCTDRHLSYLPLPHIFERKVQARTLNAGASIGFYRGDPSMLIQDIVACRPTLFAAVPRVLNKIYDKVLAGVKKSSNGKQLLFEAALRAKTEGLKRGLLKHEFYDDLVFNHLKERLGMDCIRFMSCGSAPLGLNVMLFFRCLLGVPVVEGYGQTEGSAAATVSDPSDIATFGHVGGPVPCVEILLADIPEMEYLSTDTNHRGKPCEGRGEIWVRGPSVFKGYYKDEEKTKETLNGSGWLRSGDVGLWNLDGTLQIIDRKKNIFKLAQGEYVAAEKIENVMTESLFIGQCFVYGDSLQSALVAIVVPDEDVAKKWASDSGDALGSGLDFKALCQNQSLRAAIMNDMKRLAKSKGLHGFETPKSIYLEAKQFSAENGLTTPTFKLKRQQLRDHYEKEIDDMYETMSPPPSKL